MSARIALHRLLLLQVQPDGAEWASHYAHAAADASLFIELDYLLCLILLQCSSDASIYTRRFLALPADGQPEQGPFTQSLHPGRRVNTRFGRPPAQLPQTSSRAVAATVAPEGDVGHVRGVPVQLELQ